MDEEPPTQTPDIVTDAHAMGDSDVGAEHAEACYPDSLEAEPLHDDTRSNSGSRIQLEVPETSDGESKGAPLSFKLLLDSHAPRVLNGTVRTIDQRADELYLLSRY